MTARLQYALLIFLLHRLIDLGEGNSAFADEVRDALEEREWGNEDLDDLSELLNLERDNHLSHSSSSS